MAENRKLLLSSVWALERQGFDEFKTRIHECFPGASFEVEYLHASNAVVISGRFEHDQDVKIAGMLADFIREHESPDIFQIPRIREITKLPTITPDSKPIPTTTIPRLTETPPLVENIEPIQITADGYFFEDWVPSRVGLHSFSKGSIYLLPSIAEFTRTVITEITVEGDQRLRISAPQTENVRQAVEIFESLTECFECIASPHQGLIIHAPRHENGTFLIMKYGNISAHAVWRFLIDPSLLHRLMKWMALVVCRFNPEANKFHPLQNIREPPQVKRKPGVHTTQDWKGVKFPQIGNKDSYNPSKIDKHMAPKRESSIEKIAAQHPYLSPSKVKQVDKWIGRDTTTKDIPQNEPTKPELGLKSTAAAPSVFSSRDQEHVRSRTEKPEGLKTRLTVMPDGELTNPRRSAFFSQASKQVDKVVDKSSEPAVSSVSTTGPKEDSVSNWRASKPSYDRILTREQQMRAAASSSFSANLTKPIVPASSHITKDPKLTTKQPDNMSESADLLIDIEPEVKPASLRIKDIKDKILSTYSSRTKTALKSPSSLNLSEDEPKMKDPGLSISSSGQLIDLDIPALPLSAPQPEHAKPGKKHYFFKELLSLRPDVPYEQIVNAQEYNLQKRDIMLNRFETRSEYWRRSPASHGRTNSQDTSSGTSQGTPRGRTVNSAPPTRPVSNTPDQRQLEWRDTHHKPLAERGNRPTSSPAPGLSGPRRSNVPVERPTVPTSGIANFTRSERPVKISEANRARLSLKEDERVLLMNLLQNVIEKEYTGGADSVTDIIQDLPPRSDDDAFFAPAPHASAPVVALFGAPIKAPATVVRQPAAPQQRSENIPFLHPDLIDLSPEGLMTNFGRDAVRQPDQSPTDQDDKPEVSEKIAEEEETETREYHETMFHQQPAGVTDYGLDGVSQKPESGRSQRDQNPKGNTLGRITANIGAESTETRERRITTQPLNSVAKPSKERQVLIDSTRNLFNSLGPLLNRVRSFPGILTLEIQLGLMFIVNATTSTHEKEMTYKEVQSLFFSQHSLEPPRTSFFDRLTSSPADIDYLISLKINEKPLFDQTANLRSIRYDFHCSASPNKAFTISVDQHHNITLRHPRVNLGAVSMSFPAQVWDASAVMHGVTRFNPKADPELEYAVKKMVESIWVDPESESLQMLLRPPSKEVMTINTVVMERRTSHRWISEQSKRVYLKVTETQILNMTHSVLDPDILVVNSAPHEEMLKNGKHWWQASITSAEVENTLKQNMNTKPGTRNDSWNAADLFGADITLIDPAAELSALGSTIEHSGIGAMFRLARIVVENIDAIGFFNKGPAAYVTRNTTDRGASTGIISAEARSGTVAKSQDWKNTALVKWNPSAQVKQRKHKW